MDLEFDKKVAAAIIQHLQGCIDSNTLDTASQESLNVAIQCIGDAFGLDASAGDVEQYSIEPSTLSSLVKSLEVPMPLSAKSNDQQAEALKNDGNAKLSLKDYGGAVEMYTRAIEINPHNPVYYANRAAAYSFTGEHQLAVDDCNAALKIDPKYTKAYSRLGLALFSLERYDEAVDAYKKVLSADPGNSVASQGLKSAEEKLKNLPSPSASDRSGGLSSLLNNPNLMSMAQQFMQNPQMAAMAQSFLGNTSSSAGEPSSDSANPLAGLLNNPELMNMAQQVMNNPEAVASLKNLAAQKK